MEEQNFEDSQRVKHEPPVEFVLILPRPTFGWPAIKQEKDVKPKRIPTVKLTKFDSKWRSKPKLFQSLIACPHCQLVMRSHSNLSQHLRACRKINPARFECDFCGKGFPQKRLIRKHMLRHSGEKKFCCIKCGAGFKTKHGLQFHSRSKKIYKCAVCEVKFPCKLLLDRHRGDFHGNVFKCDKCSYQTKIEQHFMNHKGTHDKSHACFTCPKKFSRNHSLKLHQMQHRHGVYANSSVETFDCGKCDNSFSTRNYLRSHEKNVHDDKEVKCDLCEEVFKNQVLLRRHNRTHKKVECSTCLKTISKRFMVSHLRSHSAGNHFKCDLCDHSSKTKGHLKRHIERMHLLRKLVNDSKCREDFSEFELLEELLLKHGSSTTASEKKFQCNICEKAFVTPNTLKEHKRTVHPKKLFECAICKKAFKAKRNLNRHRVKVHSRKQ